MRKSPLKPDSLAFSLLGAAQAVTLVRGGTALPQALAQVFAQTGAQLGDVMQARGAIQDIAYRALRQRGRSEVLLALLTKRMPEPPLLHSLLCCALALVVNSDDMPYGDFTVVDQAVTAASSQRDIAHAKGMVNAVLRRFLRESGTLLHDAMKEPVAAWNYPRWWIDAAQAAYPGQWQAILQAGNAPPPLTLRVNRRQTTVADYLALLTQRGVGARQIGPDAVRLDQPVPVAHIPEFERGMVSVQDAAAQLAAPLLDVRDGMRVLDACAAPGGKTGHILECADVELLALDADPKRLVRINENLQRLQLPASATQSTNPALKTGDASRADWWDGRPFDRILADVPCTASGIVRRHPDIRWLRRPGDAGQLATLSAQILDNLWRMLKPDGKLLFVTCSLWPQESEQQAAAFAQRHAGNSDNSGSRAERLDAPGQLLPATGLPDTGPQDHDGLFYALFRKTAI